MIFANTIQVVFFYNLAIKIIKTFSKANSYSFNYVFEMCFRRNVYLFRITEFCYGYGETSFKMIFFYDNKLIYFIQSFFLLLYF